MFKSLKLYVQETIDLSEVLSTLIELGYHRQLSVQEEGEFSRRGGIIDIFPLTFESPIRIELENNRVISIKTYDALTGESLWGHRMVIILPVRKLSATRILSYRQEYPLNNLLDLEIGDYVVHLQHGIGRYLGIDKIRINNKNTDHLVIQYDRQEKLFLPIDQLHLIQKYAAFNSLKPRKLSRLGSREWQREKERVRKGIYRFAWELLTLQAMRAESRGFAFLADTDWQSDFENTFPYEETPDQVTALKEVKKDMESTVAMDRLLCGDVGYGKTEVAMRAAFKAVMDNKQVAFLVPTTILAEQHYQNFIKRVKDFPVRVEMLSRFKTVREQKDIIKDLKIGKVDIVIGTHRLLAKDVGFKDLGLVVIDEEQRFGVKAKEKFKTVRLNTDVLTLTATPIPRTLYMSLMGIKNLSMLDSPPPNRLPIKTNVVEYDADLIKQAVRKEINRQGQVYFVHNRISDIHRVKERLIKLLPQVKIAVGHGQMPAKILEETMIKFLKGEIQLLLSTAIIESGIDVPNANTLIVNDAHHFGLSDLHQLRGRVGRFNIPAYAYFFISKKDIISTDAQKRLKAIQDFAQLGAGFRIAMLDLQIRGAGNLLGYQQHGFVEAVGFDLYCRILKETATNLRQVKNQ
jgi:transcription-repair coupling factor (superfamily II helicase)